MLGPTICLTFYTFIGEHDIVEYWKVFRLMCVCGFLGRLWFEVPQHNPQNTRLQLSTYFYNESVLAHCWLGFCLWMVVSELTVFIKPCILLKTCVPDWMENCLHVTDITSTVLGSGILLLYIYHTSIAVFSKHCDSIITRSSGSIRKTAL